MERANEEAQRLGLAGAWVVALFGILGLIGSVLAVVRTRRRLVGPLRVLADVVTDHARGASHRRCPRTEGGELGEVLGHVNELLDRIERTKPAGPDVDARAEALHHFLDARPKPTFVVDADGTVKAASASGFDAIAEDSELRARLATAAREGTLEGATVTKLGDAALVELG
jgi:HAMP domain-containing protein